MKILKSIALICSSLTVSTPLVTLNSFKDNDEQFYIDGSRYVSIDSTIQYSALSSESHNPVEVIWSTSNQMIATIDSSGTLSPVSTGKTNVIATLKSNPKIHVAKQINVIKHIPTSINIVGPDSIYIGVEQAFSITYDSEECEEGVLWDIVQGGTIAQITEDGKITASKTGDIRIQATSIYNPSAVAYKDIHIFSIKPESIQIIGDDVVSIGASKEYQAVLLPDKSVGHVSWQIVQGDPNVATLEGNILTGKQQGEVVLQATLEEDKTIFITKTIKITNYTNVKFGATVGKAFDILGPSYVIDEEPYVVRFISTQYGEDDESKRPVHKELKKTDIEVLINKNDKMSECSLTHNTLVVPANLMHYNDDIQINILGAEIADWMPWDQIKSIAETGTEEYAFIKRFFQVGDYKLVTNKQTKVAYAQIIDFYHDSYLDDGVEHKTAVTFQFMENLGTHGWSDVRMDAFHRIVQPWHSSDNDLRSYLSSDFELDIEPKTIFKYKKEEKTDESPYFILSCMEITGENPPDMISDENLDIKQYAYYNTAQYICSKNTAQRAIRHPHFKSIEGPFWLRDLGQDTKIIAGEVYDIDMNYLLGEDGIVFEHEIDADGEDQAYCPCFCF